MSFYRAFSFSPDPMEKTCSKTYAGPRVVTELMAESLQQVCCLSADTVNWCSKWEWKKKFSKEPSVRSSFYFCLHSIGWWAQLTAASLERFHSVISFISDMESLDNYFYMLTFTSSTIIPMLTQEWLRNYSKYKSLFLTLSLPHACFLCYCSDSTPPGWDVYSNFLGTKECVCLWFNTSARKARWHIYCCSENRFCMELTARKTGFCYFQEH